METIAYFTAKAANALLSKDIERTKKSMDKDRDDFEKKMAEKQKRHDDLIKILRIQENEFTNTQKEREELENKKESLNQEITNLENSINEVKENIKTNSEDLKRLTEEENQLKTNNNELKEKIQETKNSYNFFHV